MKIVFIKNPTGKYNLAYGIGYVADMEDARAQTLVDDGFAAIAPDDAQDGDFIGIQSNPAKPAANAKKAKEKAAKAETKPSEETNPATLV